MSSKQYLKMASNQMKQVEEIETLFSIYGNDMQKEGERTVRINISDYSRVVILLITMCPDYPDQAPPSYEVSAPWMERRDKKNLQHELNEVYLEHVGESVIFQWVEKIREVLHSTKFPKQERKRKSVKSSKGTESATLTTCPVITHGDAIVDRKSCFQGHAAEVHSMEEVRAVLSKLKENKKVNNAYHNMFAYRIEKKGAKGNITVLQDCDDDGESQAGGRLSHLLQAMGQKSTLVVVSRWKGTIPLGPDRFRHINSAARQVILRADLQHK